MVFELLRVHDSAYKHGIRRENILHAARHAVAVASIPTPPGANLVLGWDTKLMLLELVIVDPYSGEPIVIHAMPMREKWRNYLPKG